MQDQLTENIEISDEDAQELMKAACSGRRWATIESSGKQVWINMQKVDVFAFDVEETEGECR